MLVVSDSFSLDGLYKSSLYLLVFVSTLLPIGTIAGVPVKHAAFGACLVSALMFVFVAREPVPGLEKFLLGVFTTVLFFVFYLYIGLNDLLWSEWSIKESAGYGVSFSVIYLGLLGVLGRVTCLIGVLKAAFWGNFVFCSVKLVIVMTDYFGVISHAELIYLNDNFLGAPITTMDIWGGWTRLFVVNDLLTPFIMFFFLVIGWQAIGVSRFLSVTYILVTLCAVFFAYSRFLMVLHALSFLLSLWVIGRIYLNSFVVMLAFCLFFAFSGSIAHIVEERFLSDQVERSDSIRRLQYEGLMGGVEGAEYIGRGFGAYVDDFVRDHDAPYSYEMQWVSFLLKFGALGVLILAVKYFCVLYLIAFKNYCSYRMLKLKLSAVGLYLLSGIAAFTNPYFFNSSSSVLFILFFSYAFYSPQHLIGRSEGFAERGVDNNVGLKRDFEVGK